MNKDSLHQKLNSPYTSHNRNRNNAAPIWQMDIENSKSQGGSNLAINENWRTWHLGHRSTTGVVINVSITNHTSKTNPHAQLAVELGVGRVTRQGREKSRWYLVSAARVSTSEAEASAQGGGEGRPGGGAAASEWVSEGESTGDGDGDGDGEGVVECGRGSCCVVRHTQTNVHGRHWILNSLPRSLFPSLLASLPFPFLVPYFLTFLVSRLLLFFLSSSFAFHFLLLFRFQV